MAWTKTQKQIAVRACNAARICEEQRRDMILRHFANARMPDGRITSTAPKLTNRDFEQFMAIVENYAGGHVLHFTAGYWQSCAADQNRRLRFRVEEIHQAIIAAGLFTPDGASLRGWISKRVAKGETDRVEELDYHGLMALTLGLEAFAMRNRVALGVMDDASLSSASTSV